jgi:antitoxin component YwqK of YwqJK toxin-antitoxin module
MNLNKKTDNDYEDGPFVTYYENGQVFEKGNYNNGRIEGA